MSKESVFKVIKSNLSKGKESFRNGLVERGIYTEPELQDIEKRLSKVQDVRKNPIYLNLTGKDLKAFLKDGEWKTQHDLPLKGKRKEYDISGRGKAEYEWFGEGQHPAYGYYWNPENEFTNGSGERVIPKAFYYGDAKIKLKPSVNERSTMSYGDSFNNYNNNLGFAQPSDAMDIGLLGNDNTLWATADRFAWYDKKGVDKERPWRRIGPPEKWEMEDMASKKNDIRKAIGLKLDQIESGKPSPLSYQADDVVKHPYESDYIEAQIHGGITPADIESIQLDETIEKLPPKWKKLAQENDFSFIDKDGNCIWNCKE